MNNKLNFVFFGTPEVSSQTLDILKEKGYLPSLVVTAPDKPSGRNMLIQETPVKIWATENNIPYIQPEKLTTKELEINADLFIVVGYGKIIPEEILNLPTYGSINIHYSLLPKYRGASPVEAAILNGDTETGVAIQKMKFELDKGNIIALEKVEIYSTENTTELRNRLIQIGGHLLVDILPSIIEGTTKETIQDESQATYCKKIKKEDGLIDLNDDTIKNYNKFRAYTPWPRVFFFQGDKRVIITDAKLEDGKFVIKKVIPEGKKEMDFEIFQKSNI